MTTFILTAKDFGETIKERRKALGMTQEDLGSMIGGSRRLVSEMENGKRASSLEMALLAAAELGLDLRIEKRE
jgi:transcriptional regulator with XRE-family HTH domain